MSAIFTGENHCELEDGKKKKPSQSCAFTEEMFDEFRKQHPSPKKAMSDCQVKETQAKFSKPRARTIANDQSMEQPLNTTPPLTY